MILLFWFLKLKSTHTPISPKRKFGIFARSNFLFCIITRFVDPGIVQGKDKPKLYLYRVTYKAWDFRGDYTELYSVFDLTFYVSCLYNCVFPCSCKIFFFYNPYLRKNFNFQRVLYWSSWKYVSLWVTL